MKHKMPEFRKYKNNVVEMVTRITNSNNYYDILCLRTNATTDEVRAAYEEAIRKVSPDSLGARDVYRKVVEAFNCLQDDVLRRRESTMLNSLQRRLV